VVKLSDGETYGRPIAASLIRKFRLCDKGLARDVPFIYMYRDSMELGMTILYTIFAYYETVQFIHSRYFES
jgi:hypothetical protein